MQIYIWDQNVCIVQYTTNPNTVHQPEEHDTLKELC